MTRAKQYLKKTEKIRNNENANVEDTIATSESLVIAESVKTKSQTMIQYFFLKKK